MVITLVGDCHPWFADLASHGKDQRTDDRKMADKLLDIGIDAKQSALGPAL
jgi:hypothetical protein